VRRAAAAIAAALVALQAVILTPLVAPIGVQAAEYEMATSARYEARPGDGRVDVRVQVEFTNVTPDPPGQFSVFEEVQLAVHDQAAAPAARDADGSLTVGVARSGGVNVATVTLRTPLRYEQTATFTLSYQLPDGDDPQLRVRPSLIVFPAWGFGQRSEVTVVLPTDYAASVDGDPLVVQPDPSRTILGSGPIDDPTRWVALVTATRAASFVTTTATVPLEGGTVELQVRSFADDRAWGDRTRDLIERALPVLEREVGLPYPDVGPLVVTESAGDGVGFAEPDALETGEIRIAFDQPTFTALHQVAHVWIDASVADARWVREGLASHFAARVASSLDVALPYVPAEERAALDADAFPLDAWPSAPSAGQARYGYAAAWAVIDELAAIAGDDALREVLRLASADVGPYEDGGAAAGGAGDGNVGEIAATPEPLNSRSLLDHLELVTGEDLSAPFAAGVLAAPDVALLEPRGTATLAYERVLKLAGDWGAPHPIRDAMRAWDFPTAQVAIGRTVDWIAGRDELLAYMEAAGLTAPDRLQQSYLAEGGTTAADDELEAERAFVADYTAALAAANRERSLVGRIGLLGSDDPAAHLQSANRLFADGDLRAALDALAAASRAQDSAEASGVVRIVSAAALVPILLTVAVRLYRRRRLPGAR
jgi:hypothetical protein